MIYVFSTCGMACDGFINAFAGCVCCSRPFAGYLQLSALFLIIIAWQAFRGLPGADGIDRTVEIIGVVLALLHVVGSLHIQNQLTKGIQEQEGSADATAGHNADLLAKVWRVVLYDIGFCLYVPIFVFSFFFGIWGISSAPCEEPGVCSICVCLILFGLLAGAYITIWVCAVTCCGFADRMIHAVNRTTGTAAARTIVGYGTGAGMQQAGAPLARPEAAAWGATAPPPPYATAPPPPYAQPAGA